MTDSPVEALIEQWRKEADELDDATRGQFIEPGVLRSCADELAEALTAGGWHPEWQPIESAPKDGTHILATNGRFEPTSVHWHVDGWYLSVNMHEAYADYEAQWGLLTLWQPLPSLPSAPRAQGEGS